MTTNQKVAGSSPAERANETPANRGKTTKALAPCEEFTGGDGPTRGYDGAEWKRFALP
jgi:hypothetical protein